MSTDFNFRGKAYDHALVILQGGHPDFLNTKRGKLSSNVTTTTVTPHAGRCVHISAVSYIRGPLGNLGPTQATFEMGCAGDQAPPYYLWNGLYDWSVSNKGTPSGVASQGTSSSPPRWYSFLPSSNLSSAILTAVAGNHNMELETTEFDTDQTYASGNSLRAVTSNTLANAGKLTNQNASGGADFASSAAFSPGTDTVVGVVTRGKYYNAYSVNSLAFSPTYVRGTR